MFPIRRYVSLLIHQIFKEFVYIRENVEIAYKSRILLRLFYQYVINYTNIIPEAELGIYVFKKCSILRD